MISLISLYLPTNFEFFDKLLIKRFAANGMLLESININLINWFYDIQILLSVGISHANVFKISKCFYNLTFIFAVCYFPTGISKCYHYI